MSEDASPAVRIQKQEPYVLTSFHLSIQTSGTCYGDKEGGKLSLIMYSGDKETRTRKLSPKYKL